MMRLLQLAVVALLSAPTDARLFLWLFGRPLFPRLQCTASFLLYNFDGSDEGRFSEYYQDDSVMIVAQTGTYQGVERIREYTRFTNPEYSDFFLDSTEINKEVAVVDFEYASFEEGSCVFRFMVKARAILNPSTTSGLTYDSTFMINQHYHLTRRYFPKTYIYFPSQFLNFWYGAVTVESSRQVVCDILASDCADYTPVEANCMQEMANLPSTTGELNYVDGNSQGCRVLHSILAKQNPEMHCPHVSLDLTDKDPDQKIKCATSEGLSPSSYFSDADVQAFEGFSESVGINPEIGYELVDE